MKPGARLLGAGAAWRIACRWGLSHGTPLAGDALISSRRAAFHSWGIMALRSQGAFAPGGAPSASFLDTSATRLLAWGMNFLVTGGAGFIGSHVCERLLREGHAVWALDDLNDFYSPAVKQRNLAELQALGKAFTFVHGDITDVARLEEVFGATRFAQVIHLAARAGVRPSLQQPALYQRVNVEGTVNLLEAARRHGVRKVLLASSSSVYGINAKVPFAESDPIFSAISPYAASKLATEALGHVYHHVYGLDVVALRFFTVYGPRQRPDLAIHKFTRLMAAGKPVPVFGDGSTARDYTDITDIVEGVLACTRREFGFEIINLGGSQPVALARLIELLEAALGRKALVDYQPPQPGDVPITYADVAKARALLGYEPRVKIEEGIRRFVEWFRAQERS
jgi:UDP-glucuronate 4-epimerase